MMKVLPWIMLIALGTILTVISICKPHWLNDQNAFLGGFVNHEFLATLGFIAAVTLASASSIHFELNRLEDESGRAFPRARQGLWRSVVSLIVLFGAAVALVVIKPMFSDTPHAPALFNSAALLIMFFNLSVLYDLSATVFGIPTKRRIEEITRDNAQEGDQGR